jgi:hypothetical protein
MFKRLSYADIYREELRRIAESNDCHNPSGAGGGQFCSAPAGSGGGRKGRGAARTPATAHAAGTDAAKRSAQAGGRKAWSQEDYNAAVRAYNVVNPQTAVTHGKGLTKTDAEHQAANYTAATGRPAHVATRTVKKPKGTNAGPGDMDRPETMAAAQEERDHRKAAAEEKHRQQTDKLKRSGQGRTRRERVNRAMRAQSGHGQVTPAQHRKLVRDKVK